MAGMPLSERLPAQQSMHPRNRYWFVIFRMQHTEDDLQVAHMHVDLPVGLSRSSSPSRPQDRTVSLVYTVVNFCLIVIRMMRNQGSGRVIPDPSVRALEVFLRSNCMSGIILLSTR